MIKPKYVEELDQFVSMGGVIIAVRPLFAAWLHNYEFQNYALRAQTSLRKLEPGLRTYIRYQHANKVKHKIRSGTYLAWDRLFHTDVLDNDLSVMVAKFPVVHRQSIHNNTAEIDALVQRALKSGHNSF